MAHPLSLHHLSALDWSPPELVRAAHDAGFDHVCLFTSGWPTDDFQFPVVTKGAVLQQTRAALEETGLTVFGIDAPFLHPGVDIDDYREGLEIGASLGARQATAVIGDTDANRAVDNFAKLSELARSIGIHADIEFMRLSTLQSIDAAVRMATAAGNLDRSIAIDALHLVRTGGSPADVAGLDPRSIGNVQFCDGPLIMAEERQIDEAMAGRMLPGEGAFPLAELVAALPDGCIISIEVPNDARRKACADATAWARTLFEAASGIIRTA